MCDGNFIPVLVAHFHCKTDNGVTLCVTRSDLNK